MKWYWRGTTFYLVHECTHHWHMGACMIRDVVANSEPHHTFLWGEWVYGRWGLQLLSPLYVNDGIGPKDHSSGPDAWLIIGNMIGMRCVNDVLTGTILLYDSGWCDSMASDHHIIRTDDPFIMRFGYPWSASCGEAGISTAVFWEAYLWLGWCRVHSVRIAMEEHQVQMWMDSDRGSGVGARVWTWQQVLSCHTAYEIAYRTMMCYVLIQCD